MMEIGEVLALIRKMVENYSLPLAESLQEKGASPFLILVGAMLSTRTKDEVTARACNRLFKVVKGPSDLKKLSKRDIEELIRPVGFYRNKASYIKGLENLKKVPDTLEGLMKLKGVGRKVANLVLNVAFGREAICVDTHVHRIMNRLGYVYTKTPKETEMALRKKLPKKYWPEVNYLLVLFGQHICTPVRPHCDECLIKDCPRIGV